MPTQEDKTPVTPVEEITPTEFPEYFEEPIGHNETDIIHVGTSPSSSEDRVRARFARAATNKYTQLVVIGGNDNLEVKENFPKIDSTEGHYFLEQMSQIGLIESSRADRLDQTKYLGKLYHQTGDLLFNFFDHYDSSPDQNDAENLFGSQGRRKERWQNMLVYTSLNPKPFTDPCPAPIMFDTESKNTIQKFYNLLLTAADLTEKGRLIIKDKTLTIGISTNSFHHKTYRLLGKEFSGSKLGKELEGVGIDHLKIKYIGGRNIEVKLGSDFDANYYTGLFGHTFKNQLAMRTPLFGGLDRYMKRKKVDF